MQIDTINEPDIAQTESPKANAYSEALQAIETQLSQLAAGFEQLDVLRAEEAECVDAWNQVVAEESRILADSDTSEAQSIKNLVSCRAKKDLRNQRLLDHKKRIAGHIDLIQFDLCQPLRRDLVNLSYGLLAHRRQRVEKLFFELLGNGADHGLPVSTVDITQRSKPVRDLERFCNTVRDVRKDPDEELAEFRSELPRRWVKELRRVIEEEG
jgi:hypothetical protein